jgi:hypothetical protein
MEAYSLNKYDFKNYLLKELPDTRQIELIFWKKTIPMPVDLVYGIFEKRGELLKKYIDHIGAVYVFGYAHRIAGSNWAEAIEKQPTKDNLQNRKELVSAISLNLHRSNVVTMLKEIADKLLLYNYEIDEERIFAALCHEGRKYKRLYIPSSVREIINRFDTKLLKHIAQSNGDMFSNVVADELRVYRMGFADAFTGIFNKLIDFILSFSSQGKRAYVSASDIRLARVIELSDNVKEPLHGIVLDGSMWEPRFINGSTTCVLNEDHPYGIYVKQQGKGAEKVLSDFAYFLAEVENETVKDSYRRVIEILRQELSRKLRLRAEKAVTTG